MRNTGNSTREHLSEENENTHVKRSMHRSVRRGTIYSSHGTEAAHASSDREMDKEIVSVYNGQLLSCKRNGSSPSVTTWTDLEGAMLSETSQTKRQIPSDFTRPWNLQNKTPSRRYRRHTLVTTSERSG